jgi:Mg2+-importing ATPase
VLRRAADDAPPLAREVPADQLVPGDIVRLAPGDMVPADLMLLRAEYLAVSQSVLTGESGPVVKTVAAGLSAADAASQARAEPASQRGEPGLCFLGSTVLAGSATAVVLATGAATYLGSRQPGRRCAETSFDRAVRSVSLMLAGLMAVCVPVVLAVNASIRGNLIEALAFAVAVAAGLTPEMLPVVVTAALARGARRMARNPAIIRRLPAMHNIGAMDVLCTDKTGTLTAAELNFDFAVDSLGRADPEVLRLAWLNSHGAVFCGDGPVIDPVEHALLEHGPGGGAVADAAGPVVDVVAFDASRRRATVVLRSAAGPGRHLLITKGAPEQVLPCCATVTAGRRDRPLGQAERARISRMADEYAADGVRLLAVAAATRPARLGRYQAADEAGLTLAGFVGFRDRPLDTTRQAVARLAAAGVTVKVITGDHPSVTAKVCREVGLAPGVPVSGADIDRLDDAELRQVAVQRTVFAQVGPAQKARVVRALQAAGNAVGFLGDGVNDVAAIAAADVGICVRDSAPEARNCADVVLLRRDLLAVSLAIAEGRRTVANIGKYLKITVSANLGNVVSMLIASTVLPFLPMLPLQVLMQNLCFDACQLSWAFDTVEPESLRVPRTLDAPDLARFCLLLAPVNALADLATFVIMWRLMGSHPSAAGDAMFRAGWLTENLLTQAAAMQLLRCRGLPSIRRLAARPVLLATAVLALAGLALPFLPVARVLQLHPLPLAYFPLLLGVLAGYCLATLAAKAAYLRICARPPR